jgi:hypothetical protein
VSGSPRKAETVIYREVQHFAQPWLVTVIALVSLAGWWTFAQLVPPGRSVDRSDPVWLGWFAALFVGLAVPACFAVLRLVTVVSTSGLTVRLVPLQPRGRRLAWSDVSSARPVTYRPLRDYGGWGIRGFGGRMAYNARGDRGVLIELRGGATLLIGSQRPEELAQAIAAAMAETRLEKT